MKKYYFTFGYSHYTLDGQAMVHEFVTVEASSWGSARNIFMTNFTSEQMEKPDRFAFQYDDSNFPAHFYGPTPFAFFKEFQIKSKH